MIALLEPAMNGHPGRPPLSDDVVPLHVRVPREMRNRMAAAAEERGVPLSEWVRETLDRAARRVLR